MATPRSGRSQTRSFCYADDLIDGLIGLMHTPDQVTGPMNIGNPVEVSMLQLAKLILSLTGSRSKIVFDALPPNDPSRRQPDITCAKVTLGWEPKVALEDGLVEYVAWAQEEVKRT